MSATNAGRTPSWDFPRTAVASRHLLDTGEAHGVEATACLFGTGLTAMSLADPGCEVTAEQELTIARNLVASVADPDGLGVETGLRYHLANTGILGYALLTSPTLRDAITIVRRYTALSSAFLESKLHDTDAGMILEFDGSQIPADARQFLVERDLAAFAHLVPLLIGGAPSESTLHLELLQGVNFPAHMLSAAGLSITIDENATRNAVTLPRALLDRPMPAADPTSAAVAIQQCEELLDRRTRRGGLSAAIRARLIQKPAGMPSMAEVAREHVVTERTLHRRLAAEHTSYRALVEEVREALAIELLSNDFTVEQVARHLGYAETASFTHAFTRWRGYPPSRHPNGR